MLSSLPTVVSKLILTGVGREKQEGVESPVSALRNQLERSGRELPRLCSYRYLGPPRGEGLREALP